MAFDPDSVRHRFPALAIEDDGRPRIYFDNPAGTQVPEEVIARMRDCLVESNANLGGPFRTSELADEVVDEAHAAMADFLNARSPSEIVFGQNMTTLTFSLSRSIGRVLSPGDEIVLSRMCHDANVYPWMLLARDHGLAIRWLPFDTGRFEIDLDALDSVLSEKTRLVCVGGASNLLGTLNDISEISRRARDAGAWTWVDAVQSAPHVPTDVQAIGCDFLAVSAYKFFGPHQGILWGREELLESLPPYKLRPASDAPPGRFETGTQSHEGMAGTRAAVDYFASLGEGLAAAESRAAGRGSRVRAALEHLSRYEETLSRRLVDGLSSLPGITVHGITAPDKMARRVPTVAFTHQSVRPAHIACELGKRNIFVWSGHNYAVEPAKALGLYEEGGAVRVGAVHYNTAAEIDTFLAALEDIVS